VSTGFLSEGGVAIMVQERGLVGFKVAGTFVMVNDAWKIRAIEMIDEKWVL